MGFEQLTLEPEYRSFEDDIIKDFYIPVLNKSIHYKRAVGYFSSSALIEVTKGISGLINNKGKIQIIASPQLSREDIVAIEQGYEKREDVITNNIVTNLDLSTEDTFEKKRLNLLAWLISNNVLDIRIAFIESTRGIGIYHEKMGIVEDTRGNKIVFSGSMNETKSALSYNYESFDVFCTWKDEKKRIASKESAFDKLWNNTVNQVTTIEFPKVAKERLESYIFEEPDFDLDNKELITIKEAQIEYDNYLGPKLPQINDFELRPYQQEAIEEWKKNNYTGIFDMATGTGKTITALGAATELFENNNRRLALVIVCPYQHLVEQWVEDIQFFDMRPIIGYSTSKQRDWRSRLRDSIDAFNYGINDHFCFVTTNATFSTERIQRRLQRIKGDFLLIIDEAHNFGARNFVKALLDNATYRLALSATIDRHNDEEGTNLLYEYFGKKCIEYTLRDAIDNNMLTPYEYYPIPVHLTEGELEIYRRLTYEISKRIIKDQHGKIRFKDSAKYYLIQRARVIAGAKNKLTALRDEIKQDKDSANILVYCGATTINDTDYEEGSPTVEEVRQIDAVISILGNELNMNVAKFTSEEDSIERENLRERFAKNENLQALIAIRCLDEGVNIPSIQKAYILASSTNPKEYIQRRGRVLRKFEGKEKAIIYDFITLPVPLEEISLLTEKEIMSYRGLINREVIRMKDFVEISENPFEADSLIFDLKRTFNLREGVSDNEQFV